MRVIVVYELDGEDIRYRMIIPGENRVSWIERLEKKASIVSGNPYGVFGDVCAIYARRGKYSLNITVACCTSGGL